MSYRTKAVCLLVLVGFSGLLIFQTTAYAQDGIMGQIEFKTSAKAVKNSGVWIDGQYVGYLGELKGSKRIRLLPGEHEIVVRQAGYSEFAKKAMIEPGLILDVRVTMNKDPRFTYPDPKNSSEIRLQVQPDRAAVFLDDHFVGHVSEYHGIGRAMLVAPGKHRIKIALPGFKAFESVVELLPHQKFMLETSLVQGSITDADPLIRNDSPGATSSAKDEQPSPAQ